MNVGPERHVDSTTANKNSDAQEGCSVMENFAPHKMSSKRFKRPVVPRVNWAAAGKPAQSNENPKTISPCKFVVLLIAPTPWVENDLDFFDERCEKKKCIFFFFLSSVAVWYYSFVQPPTFQNFLFCSSLSFILHTYCLWSVSRLVARVTQDEKVQGSPMQFRIAKDYNGCFCSQAAACQTECLLGSRAQL